MNTPNSLFIALLSFAGLLAAPVAYSQATNSVSAVVVERRAVDLGFPAEATVEAVRQATVAAQIAGRILDVRADAGQRVAQGQLLARVDAREAASGEAASRAQLAQAKANYERTRNLFAQKFVSQAALDQAETAYKAAQATTGASSASVSHASISSPISGVVAQRYVQAGDMATPGAPLFTIFEPKGLRVVASIPQYKLAEIRQAASARIEFPELKQTLTATRIEVLPTVDARSHTATVRLYLPEGIPGIVPGMAARALFAIGQGMKLTVPAAAIVRRGEVTAVYVLPDQGVPKLRQVRLGEPVANGDIEILAGLSSGERVSLEPVKAGITVRQTK
jgi:RND family efflux transporter MFP subunit